MRRLKRKGEGWGNENGGEGKGDRDGWESLGGQREGKGKPKGVGKMGGEGKFRGGTGPSKCFFPRTAPDCLKLFPPITGFRKLSAYCQRRKDSPGLQI